MKKTTELLVILVSIFLGVILKNKLLKSVLGVILISSLFLNLKFYSENQKLKSTLDQYLQRIDNFYGQIDELSFIINKAGHNFDKKEVYDAINIYSSNRITGNKKRGIETIEIPPGNSSKKIHGFHSEIKFIFNEQGNFKTLELRKYSPTYLRVN